MVPIRFRDVEHRSPLERRGAVHDDVETAERAFRVGDETCDVVAVRDVRLDGYGAAPAPSDLRRRLAGFIGGCAVMHDDVRARIRERERHDASKAARGTGYEGNFAGY